MIVELPFNALSAMVLPAIGLEKKSVRVTVIVDGVEPSAGGFAGLAVTVVPSRGGISRSRCIGDRHRLGQDHIVGGVGRGERDRFGMRVVCIEIRDTEAVGDARCPSSPIGDRVSFHVARWSTLDRDGLSRHGISELILQGDGDQRLRFTVCRRGRCRGDRRWRRVADGDRCLRTSRWAVDVRVIAVRRVRRRQRDGLRNRVGRRRRTLGHSSRSSPGTVRR